MPYDGAVTGDGAKDQKSGASPQTTDSVESTGTRSREQVDHLGMMETMASGEIDLDAAATGGRSIPQTKTPASDAIAATSLPPEQELELGSMLDHYRVVRRLAGGGMGAVYVVEHVELGKQFAAKVVLSALASFAGAVDRLKQEARTLSAVEHPNIVNVSHLGTTPSGLVYVVMELLRGQDLGDRLAQQQKQADADEGDAWLPDEEVRRLVPQLLSALSAAHRAGVVHRDLKPDNVFLAERHGETTVKVVDFGISKVRGEGQLPVGLTQTGQILGTPLYMAPEQSRSTSQVDARADIYSLGCILYELLTGTVPFSAKSPYECVVMHTVEPVPPPSERRPNLPVEVETMVLRCLKKVPGDRFGSAEEMLTAWEDAWRAADGDPATTTTSLVGVAPDSNDLPNAPIKAGMLRWLAPVLATLALLAGGGLFLRNGTEEGAPAIAATTPPGAPELGVQPAAPITTPARTRPAAADPQPAEDDVPTDPGAPATVSKHVSSQPSGASVYIDGALRGHTPLDLDVPAEGELEILLRHPGHRPLRHTLHAEDEDTVRLRLHRSPRTGSNRPGLAPL